MAKYSTKISSYATMTSHQYYYNHYYQLCHKKFTAETSLQCYKPKRTLKNTQPYYITMLPWSIQLFTKV